jgi:hypothetical protein
VGRWEARPLRDDQPGGEWGVFLPLPRGGRRLLAYGPRSVCERLAGAHNAREGEHPPPPGRNGAARPSGAGG